MSSALFHSYQQALDLLQTLPCRLPASVEVIRDLEGHWDCKIPARLREVLMLDYRVYDWMFNIQPAKMRTSRDEFNRIMKEDGSRFQFTSTDIVVWEHQGYIFDYFQSIPECEDPFMVMMYSGHQQPSQAENRLSDRFMNSFRRFLSLGES